LKDNGSSNVRGVRDDEADGYGDEENANEPKGIADDNRTKELD
jgi:hypothetical protein